MEHKVLFVDDDCNVLQGLHRMLRSMRRHWDMRFAESGQEALGMVQEDPPDVIVTDMRMPGMDGAELLSRLTELKPHVVRIIMSGHSDQGLILKAIEHAHQYIAKPCDSRSLQFVITKTLSFRTMLPEEFISRAVSQLVSLPSQPAAYLELLEAVQSEECTIRDAARIVAGDPAMAAKVLQLVSTAFFGLPQRVNSPQQAAELLGLDTMRALALSAGVFSPLEDKNNEALLVDLAGHSEATANLARSIAEKEGFEQKVVGEAFLAGMLHDVGKLVLATIYPDRYRQTVFSANQDQVPLEEAEKREFGTTHAMIGAYLLGLWGLDDRVVRTVAYHQEPSFCGEKLGSLAAVHVADLVQRSAPDEAAKELDQDYLRAFNLMDRFAEWGDVL